MTSTSKQSPAVINLSKILYDNDHDQVKQMQNEFERNGWCFVLLPTDLIPSPELLDKTGQFFTGHSRKTKYSQEKPVYGYVKFNHKEGIKVLTGSYFEEIANKGLVPDTIVEPLNYLAKHLDAYTKRLIEVLDQYGVFQDQPSIAILAEKADLPMKEEHFGMLDIVSYFNEKHGSEAPTGGTNTDQVNCAPHYDPGLLSISVLSTHEGLQLKERSSEHWIDGPTAPDVGLIWLGAAASHATNNRLKPGIHRVIYPQTKNSRLTIWYEVCTVGQLRNIRQDREDEVMEDGKVTFDGLLDQPPIDVRAGERKLEFLRRIEEAYGLSMSKLGPPVYYLDECPISFERKNDAHA